MLNKNIILSLIVGMFLIGLVSPIDILPVQKQFDCVNIPQTCADCSFVNITVLYPNGTVAVANQEMTKLGARYNYTFCQTYVPGEYLIETLGDVGGVDTVASYSFEVTSTGVTQNSILNNSALIFLVVVAILFTFGGIYFKTSSIGFMGSVLFLLSGLYTMIYGFNNITDMYSRGIAVSLLGIGIFFMIVSAYELIWSEDEE